MNDEIECTVRDAEAPVLELSKKRMPTAPDNIITVRELVKAKQEERKKPVGDMFLQRMEDTLMRWKPPVSSHQGATMAVDGMHPFQLPTAKIPVGDIGGSDSSRQAPTESVAAYNSINRWWRQRIAMRPKSNDRAGAGDNRGEDEEDDFSFNFGEDENIRTNRAMNNVSNSRTPYGVPAHLAFSETSKEERETIYRNEQEIYQQYYQNPVPDEYLAVAHNGETHNKQSSSPWFLGWIKSCFPLCTGM
ncbi:hypothetical protein HG535_0E04680 [Zygotorulaspora mrakii]|uniref:Uncharacterized protein n=1 Tax=Zygotorulaspora mrakii TaxID=42260 RepID=A0A7H9B4U5_ZYGMR|nr:uncharacterized protein HG535_0E04680 [Zygotorulaspora mrakii]QLG73384.1 hypothetical protein HG535_0E04680 [Zygotorulaspora mrakii]